MPISGAQSVAFEVRPTPLLSFGKAPSAKCHCSSPISVEPGSAVTPLEGDRVVEVLLGKELQRDGSLEFR